MILRRIGNKSKIAKEIQKYFPSHEVYCEPFFGAGGMFFNKPIAKYNYLNDIDNNIHNLFIQLMTNKDELYKWIESIPYHKSTWNWLKKLEPENDVIKAVKFVVLSNYGYMGKPETINYQLVNSKIELLKNIQKTFDFLCKSDYKFNNVDFREFIKQFSFKSKRDNNERDKTFWYCDPPYINCINTYSDSFKEQDFIDLVDCLIKTGCKFAISEFDQEFILQTCSNYNLNINIIGERCNLKNKRTEILITNYLNHPKLFDF
jgi:DNA adenine methylase